MARLLAAVAGLCGFASLVFAGCSGSTFEEGQQGGGPSGGTSSAGQSGSGGKASGGAGGTNSDGMCKQDSDCVACAYDKAPATAQDCYCTNCKWKPMAKTECSANQSAYDKVCANVRLLCPAIACVIPPVPRCDGGMCVASTNK